MHTAVFIPTLRTSRWFALALIVGGGLLCSRGSADDRFIVPVPDSSPPPPPPPPPPAPSSSSSSSSSDSGASSYSSSSSSSSSSAGSSYSYPTDNRFVVPVPGGRPYNNNSSGNVGGGPIYGSGGYDARWNNYYSGGCFYWGDRYYYGDGYSYSPFDDGLGFNRSRFPVYNSYAPRSPADRLPIFFPPSPPPLDTPAPLQAVGDPGLIAPTELAPYVYDPFYAPLSTRLAQRNLPDPLRQRLDAYQATKTELQAQLHAKLASLASADSAAKESALAAFAREQTPRVVTLEADAERLRTDLLRSGLVGLFSGTGDWNEHRTWHIGGRGWPIATDDESLVPEFRVMRAAVYYQEGLTPAQRRLLREVAMELQAQAFAPAGKAITTDDDTTLFFSPETARVRLPADLPKELAAKLTAYRREKSTLKAQLHDTLFQQDAANKAVRAQALKQLAVTQTPRIAALDQLAEEIRQGLAALPSRLEAAAPALPADLAAQIAAHRQDRRALQEAVRAKLEEIGQILPSNQFTVVENAAGSSGVSTLALTLRPTVRSSEKRQRVEEAVADFNTENRERVASMQRAWTNIRQSAAAYLAAHPEIAEGKTAESLLQDFAVAAGQKEARPRYEDYATAVFQPGLSPEQRRLLFDAALQKLALPLPGGEPQP